MDVKIIDKEEYSELEKGLEFVTVISSQPRIVNPVLGIKWKIYDRQKNLDELCDLCTKKGGHYIVEISNAKYFNECFKRGFQPVPTYNNINRVYGMLYKKKEQ